MADLPEDQTLMARAAWLYHIGGLNQEAQCSRRPYDP